MRLRSRLKWFVSFAVLAYAASPAGAQTPAVPPATQGVDAQVGFKARVAVTPEQQVAEGASFSRTSLKRRRSLGAGWGLPVGRKTLSSALLERQALADRRCWAVSRRSKSVAAGGCRAGTIVSLRITSSRLSAFCGSVSSS